MNPQIVSCIRQGSSLVVPITKICKEMGIVPGDKIRIWIQKVETPEKPIDFDPKPIGDRIKFTLLSCQFSECELVSLINTYDSNPDHIEAVMAYIKEQV